MTLGGRGLSLLTFWISGKLSSFKAQELSWTVNELCTRILRVLSSCPHITHIHRRQVNSLKKIILDKSNRKKKKQRKKEKEKKTYPQATRQRKLEIALNLLFFKDVTITDNLQNLRFNQHSPKNMNQNMLCFALKINCCNLKVSADCCEA